MFCYARDYLYNDEVSAREFFETLPERIWNDKGFILELLEQSDIIYTFFILFEYISEELKQDDEVKEKLEEYE